MYIYTELVSLGFIPYLDKLLWREYYRCRYIQYRYGTVCVSNSVPYSTAPGVARVRARADGRRARHSRREARRPAPKACGDARRSCASWDVCFSSHCGACMWFARPPAASRRCSRRACGPIAPATRASHTPGTLRALPPEADRAVTARARSGPVAPARRWRHLFDAPLARHLPRVPRHLDRAVRHRVRTAIDVVCRLVGGTRRSLRRLRPSPRRGGLAQRRLVAVGSTLALRAHAPGAASGPRQGISLLRSLCGGPPGGVVARAEPRHLLCGPRPQCLHRLPALRRRGPSGRCGR